jgi:hypothetical protein
MYVRVFIHTTMVPEHAVTMMLKYVKQGDVYINYNTTQLSFWA